MLIYKIHLDEKFFFVILIGLIPIGIDGLGQLFAFWESTNIVRVITGLLIGVVCGLAIGIIIDEVKEIRDWKKAKRVILPDLKPSVKTISLRLPESMLEEIKLLANKRDVPYQSLMKIFLSERIEKELSA